MPCGENVIAAGHRKVVRNRIRNAVKIPFGDRDQIGKGAVMVEDAEYRPVWAMGAGGSKAVVKLGLKLPSLLTSFGEDPNGELWILSLYDGVYKLEPA